MEMDGTRGTNGRSGNSGKSNGEGWKVRGAGWVGGMRARRQFVASRD